jgi:phage tail tape-measure protein
VKRRLALLLVLAVGAVGSASVAPAVGTVAPQTAAKPCGSGYVHAVLSWGHKCLRTGQFCKQSADREYHRYRFHCHSSGRLTR